MKPNRDTDRAPAGLLIVNVTDRVLFGLLLACIAITLLGWGGIGFVALTNVGRIDDQADARSRLVKRIDAREAADNTALREAAARICARENLTRAELHYIYATAPNQATTRAQAASLERGRDAALRRVRHSLPILDCSPNLKGRRARALSASGQARFVKAYGAGELDPTPEADDVNTGPDEPGPRRR